MKRNNKNSLFASENSDRQRIIEILDSPQLLELSARCIYLGRSELDLDTLQKTAMKYLKCDKNLFDLWLGAVFKVYLFPIVSKKDKKLIGYTIKKPSI